MSTNKFGKNLMWFLGELANAELEQIETGEIEIFGEDEHGNEGSTDCCIFGLVQAAIDRIKELEAAAVFLIRDRYGRLAPVDAEYFSPQLTKFLRFSGGKLYEQGSAGWVISTKGEGVIDDPETICVIKEK